MEPRHVWIWDKEETQSILKARTEWTDSTEHLLTLQWNVKSQKRAICELTKKARDDMQITKRHLFTALFIEQWNMSIEKHQGRYGTCAA